MPIWSTSIFRRDQRFAYWTDVVCRSFVPVELSSHKPADFSGTISSAQIGYCGIFIIEGSEQTLRRTTDTIERHPSESVFVTMPLFGASHFQHRKMTLDIKLNIGSIFYFNSVYELVFPTEFKQLVLTVPREKLLTPNDSDGFVDPVAIDVGSRAGHMLKRLALMSAVDHWENDGSPEDDGIADAIATLVRSASTVSVRRQSPDDLDQIRWMAAIDYVDCHLFDPRLSREAVASALGISVRSLTRLFASHGETVERLVWAKRLDGSREVLAANPQKPIVEIALESGFSDAAHFSNRFLKQFGMTPSEFRLRSRLQP